MVILYILLFILILGIVVCIHELGHFFFAKKANILVTEFAFGMGPKLLSKTKGETEWSIRVLPIGGFCAMSGEEVMEPLFKVGDKVKLIKDDSNEVIKVIINPDTILVEEEGEIVEVNKMDLFGKDMSPLYINDYIVKRDAFIYYTKKDKIQIAPEERVYYTKTLSQRFLVCFGGPLNNILLSLFLFLILGFMVGVANTSSNKIDGAQEGTSSYEIGLKKGDLLKEINNTTINSIDDYKEYISIYTGRSFSLTIERDNQSILFEDCYLTMAFQNIGINSMSKTEYEKMNFTTEFDPDTVMIIVESDAALGGTNKSKANEDGKLENGDIIKEALYNNEVYAINSWNDLSIFAQMVDGGEVQFRVDRFDGTSYNSFLSLKYEAYSDKLLSSQGYSKIVKSFGISATTTIKFFPCLLNGLKYFADSALIIFSTLWLLITSKEVGLKDMGGFITILNQTASYAEGGITNIIYWVGLLSVNLGIMNLLPIPALDGGRILFIIIEAITKKKLKPKTETLIINITFYLLLALIVYVLFNDILRMGTQLFG